MIKRGISGGMLKITSLIESSDRQALVNNAMIKTSSSIREAAKIGLQSLYANADEVLDKYKDFDIIKEMKSRDGANLLWVRARAIDANVVNTNGDYFSEEELLKEAEYQGKMMPAYKTFEGVPIYTNHQNDKIEEAKGMVVYSEWETISDEQNNAYLIFRDEQSGMSLASLHDIKTSWTIKKVTNSLSSQAFSIFKMEDGRIFILFNDAQLVSIDKLNQPVKVTEIKSKELYFLQVARRNSKIIYPFWLSGTDGNHIIEHASFDIQKYFP
jgi:hypothetical protein